jgi:hypothetical protein
MLQIYVFVTLTQKIKLKQQITHIILGFHVSPSLQQYTHAVSEPGGEEILNFKNSSQVQCDRASVDADIALKVFENQKRCKR